VDFAAGAQAIRGRDGKGFPAPGTLFSTFSRSRATLFIFGFAIFVPLLASAGVVRPTYVIHGDEDERRTSLSPTCSDTPRHTRGPASAGHRGETRECVYGLAVFASDTSCFSPCWAARIVAAMHNRGTIRRRDVLRGIMRHPDSKFEYNPAEAFRQGAPHGTLAARLPIAALEKAIAERKPPPGLVHHSDRGVQYASGD
jgi:hypothetical protein